MTEAEMRDLIHQHDSLNARRAADEDHDDEAMAVMAGDLRDALEAVLAERDALAAKSDRLDVLLSADPIITVRCGDFALWVKRDNGDRERCSTIAQAVEALLTPVPTFDDPQDAHTSAVARDCETESFYCLIGEDSDALWVEVGR